MDKLSELQAEAKEDPREFGQGEEQGEPEHQCRRKRQIEGKPRPAVERWGNLVAQASRQCVTSRL